MSWIAIILALISLQASASVPATVAPTWTWFRSVSTGTDWWTTAGKGSVDLSGSLFKATLRDREDPQFVRLSLQGSVSAGLVKARLTVHESDVPVVQVSGKLKRLCWKGGGREILVLTNGEQVVGLFRELDPSTPCKPAQ